MLNLTPSIIGFKRHVSPDPGHYLPESGLYHLIPVTRFQGALFGSCPAFYTDGRTAEARFEKLDFVDWKKRMI